MARCITFMRSGPTRAANANDIIRIKRPAIPSKNGVSMNANEKFIAAEAHVDEAAVAPLPNSRKIYVEGSRPDIRVPMRDTSATMMCAV